MPTPDQLLSKTLEGLVFQVLLQLFHGQIVIRFVSFLVLAC